MTRIGILSDTHISDKNITFLNDIKSAFKDCDVIIHAGDLTEVAILNAFDGKEVHAVHGNMCSLLTKQSLPESKMVTLNGYLFAICHGANGPRHNIEDRLFTMFPEAHCIIYGHTHTPVCHQIGSTLIINPGSFTSTGRYGAPGTYGIVSIDQNGLHGAIFDL